MEITISLSPEKTALFFKLLEEGAFKDTPIISAHIVEETGVRYKYVLANKNQTWNQARYEKKRLELKQLEKRAVASAGKAMA
jgi:hypothetical protein